MSVWYVSRHSYSHPFYAAWIAILQTTYATSPILRRMIEVKFEPEHVAGVEPRVEPITADVVDKMERFPDGVEITQTSSSKEGCKNSDKDH
jgi:hypothetical protein